MTEYWKSNPRKFCDFCKCWISDNRPSVEFHERGKRHKENVEKKVEEIAKKGKQDHENKLKHDDFMREMEEQALKAYKKDIERNPDLMGEKLNQIAEASNATIVIGVKDKEKEISASTENPTPKIAKKWHEVKTPEGNSYYWNTQTGETEWEAPKEGFLSLDEKNLKKSTKKGKKSKNKKAENVAFGPVQRAEAYSQWETVENSHSEVNLQLPEVIQEDLVIPEIVFKKPEISFKEKTVTLSVENSNSSKITFKKRKGNEELKKNVRKRIDDS